MKDDAGAAAAIAFDGQGYRERRFHAQDGLQLYYREYGPDHHVDGSERIPVLCLPGLTRNSRDFHDFALRLAPQRRVLAMDYRGRGRSARDPDWRNYRPESYISDIFDLLAVADAPKIVAVGTSMGGLMTMGLAAYRPTCLAGAVLNDIGPDVDPEGYRRILAYIGADRPHPDYDAAIADMRELFPSLSFQTEAAWQRLAEGTYRRGVDGLLHFDWDIALARALGASQARYPDLWPMFRGLGQRPVLALRGAMSDVLSEATFDRMAEEKPDLLRAVIPGVGHVPALDEKESTLALDDFFARIETLPTAADVEAAAQRIADKAVETPLLESPALNERLGGRIFLKPESLQRTGSFKFRGAYNKLRRLVEQKGARGGVVAFSSGNHAQGVAAAASLLVVKAVIVMPSDAPAIKLANTRAYGAEVVLYDRARENREAIADKLAADRGAAIVRPFDDPDIIAGQGTVGLEIYRQSRARGVDLDAVLIPAGGGGLISGSTLALKAGWPALPVYACEPAGYDDTTRSLAAHRRLAADTSVASLCDGLLSPMPGVLTFALNDRLLAGGFAVSDEEVLSAMAFAFRVLKLVIEPSGAVCLAALLAGKLDCRGRKTGIVISGGNVDPAMFARAIGREE